ncbi:hypothetical protein [Zoogloea sp. LCSB751]|uniref:hypothetical protein n=1 Tax=Zoogloea sp. LCSB751 TaxID=1965277 RepID=UPI0009A550E7|nr:hypothetical protein [Zoogloea sp. LCSB751]
MTHATFPRLERSHAWAPSGEWDWTVHASLLGSLLLCGGMLFAAAANHAATASQTSPCVRKLDEVYRVLGPSAWGVLRECRAPEALSLHLSLR